MQPITVDELRSIPDFEAVRDDLRRRIIALKKHRRLYVGPRISMVFENRETVSWQIHEMVRAEHIEKRAALAYECDTYNKLLPDDHTLSATLFIEVDQSEQIRPVLDQLLGIDEHTALVVGGETIPGHFDPAQYSGDRISAVHYVRFALSDTQRQRFLDRSVTAKLVVDHPSYQAETEITGETRRELCDDLT